MIRRNATLIETVTHQKIENIRQDRRHDKIGKTERL